MMIMMMMRVAVQVPHALSCGRCSAVDSTWFVSAETPTCSAWIRDSCRHSNALVLLELSLGLGIH